MTRAELIARVEAASGGDRELDRLIGGWEVCQRMGPDCNFKTPMVWAEAAKRGNWNVPAYTGSIDAAIKLVPEGWRIFSADFSIEGRSSWTLEGPKTLWETDRDGYPCAGADWYSQGITATPALALVAACLRAGGE